MRIKKTGKTALIIVSSVLIAVAICSMFGAITKGFTDFDMKELNSANYINVDEYVQLPEVREDGLSVKVSDTGEITVSGKNETAEAVKIAIQEVTLDIGKYTLGSNCNTTSEDTYYLCVETGEGEDITTVIADTDNSTFTVKADDTVYTVYIVINVGERINATFKPVLNEGASLEPFYVIGK